MKVSEDPGPVLILTPTGRDATLAAEALAEAGIASEICRNLAELSERVGEDAAAVLLAEEALSAAGLPQFLERLRAQPAWSDLPLLILTSAAEREDTASVEILKLFGPSGNVTLLERPLRSVVLVSTVQVALRARRRQHEVRNLIEERETVLASISDAFSALDRNWRYTHVNDKVAELAGWPKEKMIGRVIWEIFPEAVGTD
ncbi:MAG TPA: PAS domain-containing protein, partial [Chthoniobacterales bacterium]